MKIEENAFCLCGECWQKSYGGRFAKHYGNGKADVISAGAMP
jgi:hypothetical protein